MAAALQAVEGVFLTLVASVVTNASVARKTMRAAVLTAALSVAASAQRLVKMTRAASSVTWATFASGSAHLLTLLASVSVVASISRMLVMIVRFYVQPTFTAVSGAVRTNVTFALRMRFAARLFGDGSGIGGDTRIKRKTLFPQRSIPLVERATGLMTDTWYRALQFIYEKKLGGDLAPSLPEVKNSVAVVQENATTALTALTNITQVVETNAASQAASIEVAQNAGDAGAEQIPPPILTVPTSTHVAERDY